MPTLKLTCKICKTVAMGVSREFAENEIRKFNSYFESLTRKEQKEKYGSKKASIKQYEHCILCGNHYTNYRYYRAGDAPPGTTLNPIIWEDIK